MPPDQVLEAPLIVTLPLPARVPDPDKARFVSVSPPFAVTVPAEIVSERMARLTEAVERHALARNQARIGRREEVLVEGASKSDPTQRSGRTRQGKLVHFAGDEIPIPHAGAAGGARINPARTAALTGFRDSR